MKAAPLPRGISKIDITNGPSKTAVADRDFLQGQAALVSLNGWLLAGASFMVIGKRAWKRRRKDGWKEMTLRLVGLTSCKNGAAQRPGRVGSQDQNHQARTRLPGEFVLGIEWR